MRPSRAPPVADDPEHGGGRGLGGTPSLGRPRERRPLFGDVYRACTDLIGRRVRPGGLFRPPMGCLQNFWGGTLGGVSMYHDIFKRMQQAARFLFSFRRGRGPTDGGAYFSLRITVPLRSYSRVFVCEIRKFEVCYIDFSRPSPESKSGRGIHQKNRFLGAVNLCRHFETSRF